MSPASRPALALLAALALVATVATVATGCSVPNLTELQCDWVTVAVEAPEPGHRDSDGVLRECLRVDVVSGPGAVRRVDEDESCGAWGRCVTLVPGELAERAVHRLSSEPSSIHPTAWPCESMPPCSVPYEPSWAPE